VYALSGDVQQVRGITDRIIRGKPTIEHGLLRVIQFLRRPNTILVAHNVPSDLGFLAMVLTRLGIACPPHYLFDTLDMTRRLYPTWPSHSMEKPGNPAKAGE
jgi:DNA polymerase III alpha subunit (gram-positive type)